MEETKVVETPAKFKAIVEAIETMSVIDLHELVKHLEEKFGVSAAVAAAPAAAAAAAAARAGLADRRARPRLQLHLAIEPRCRPRGRRR